MADDASMKTNDSTRIDGPLSVRTQRTIHSSENLLIQGEYFTTNGCVFVSFGTRDYAMEPFGDAVFARYGLNVIHVMSRGPHWYQYPDLPQALEALATATAEFERVITYGASMGAYGALLFARRLKASLSIAYSPQYSIDPAKAPYEIRYRADAKAIQAEHGFLHDDIGAGMNPAGRSLVLYDPHDLDIEHIRRLRACGPIEEVLVPFASHRPIVVLAEMGLASRLLVHAAADMLNPKALRRDIRLHRNRSSTYLRAAARRLQRRQGAGTAELLRRTAAALRPNDITWLADDVVRLVKFGEQALATRHLQRLLQDIPFVSKLPSVGFVLKHAALLATPEELSKVEATLAPLIVPGVKLKKSLAPLHALMMLAGVQAAAGATAAAEASLARALKEPTGASFRLEAARLYDSIGQAETAQRLARLVLEAEPGDHDAATFLAERLAPAEAGAVLQAADAANPLPPRQALRLARHLVEQGEAAAALALCNRVLANDPADHAVLKLRAITLAAQGRHDEACRDFLLMREVPTMQLDGLVGMAKSFEALGLAAAAAELARQALVLAPKRGDMIRLLGRLASAGPSQDAPAG